MFTYVKMLFFMDMFSRMIVQRRCKYTYGYVGNLLTKKTARAAQLSLAFSSKYEYDYAGRIL